MSFELWLFAVKRLAQTMDAAQLIYDGLSDADKERLKKEYDEFIAGGAGGEEKELEVSIRKFSDKDLTQMIKVWNEIVDEGNSFPQEDKLDIFSGKKLFKAQSYSGVAECDGKIVGLYILHPDGEGRCGHICNASFAVSSECRGKHVGEKLVKDCIEKAGELGFMIIRLNAVVETNTHARHLYERLGFMRMGIIPGGFRMKDGHYENICPYYRIL